MSNNEQIVKDFCAATSSLDLDKILAFFTDDAVYHNIPMDPVTGHDGIRGVLNMFVPMSKEIEFKIHKIASAGDVVFTERDDIFVMEGGTITLPVAGVFEITDGKISAWRDYFDMQQFMSQMPTG